MQKAPLRRAGATGYASAAGRIEAWEAEAGAMRLDGMRVAVLVAEGVEDLEYWVTVMRLREEGAEVASVGHAVGEVRGKNGLAARADVAASDVRPEDVDALVIPGGWAPDKLRRYGDVTRLVRAVFDAGRPIGIICHGGLVAISAGIVRGSRATGSLGIRDDLVNAGATWVDEPAFRDGQLVWGRVVEDIPAFERELVDCLASSWQGTAAAPGAPVPGHPPGATTAAAEAAR